MIAAVAEMWYGEFKGTVIYLLLAELSMRDNLETLALESYRLKKIKC